MDQRTLSRLITAFVLAVIMSTYAFALGRRVPLLGWADLGFHELGHMLAIPLGTVIHFIAGSATQILVPLGLATYFWITQREPIATGFTMVWGATSMQDASVYIADAPYQRLQLIGGQHDWAFLLGRWDMIDRADEIASMLWLSGLTVALFGLALIVSPLAAHVQDKRAADAVAARFANAPIRERRPTPPLETG